MKLSYRAILLLGPTGSGKTPLGNLIENRGFKGARAAHFDFGEHLRRAAASPESYPSLSREEVDVVSAVIETGALLLDSQFPIAKKLLASFVEATRLGERDWLVLNGLPRHEGQAADLESMVTVLRLIVLDCPEDEVFARIAKNTGGDRTHRTDDDELAVRRKLALYDEQTRPLLDHYGRKGVSITRIEVFAESTPDDILAQIK